MAVDKKARATVAMPWAMIDAAESYLGSVSLNGHHELPAQFNWHEFYAALEAAKPVPELAVDGVREPYAAIVKRLLNPPFGTETSERLLMGTAADAIRHLAKQEADIRAAYVLRRADNMELERENKRLDREWEAAEEERHKLEGLIRRIEPHIDAIVDYASTMGEHEPNRIAHEVRSVCLGPSQDELAGQQIAAKMIAKIDAAIAKPSAQRGWLIELRGQRPSWAIVDPNDYDEHWTTDSARALRFARREDAQTYIDHIGWTEAFPSEHIWDDGRAARTASSPAQAWVAYTPSGAFVMHLSSAEGKARALADGLIVRAVAAEAEAQEGTS